MDNGPQSAPSVQETTDTYLRRERGAYFTWGVLAGVAASVMVCFLLNVILPLAALGSILVLDRGTLDTILPWSESSYQEYDEGMLEEEFEYDHVDASESVKTDPEGRGTVMGYLTGEGTWDDIGTGSFTIAMRPVDGEVEDAKIFVAVGTKIMLDGEEVKLARLMELESDASVTVDFKKDERGIHATRVVVMSQDEVPSWVFQ